MASVWSRLMSAGRAFVATFREQNMQADPSEAELSDFSAPDSRRSRYALLWAAYDNTIYRDIHRFARLHKAAYSLYKYIRNIHSPAYRLAEFYAIHLHGGSIDYDKNKGVTNTGAIPIETENEALRPAIGKLFQDSRWDANKSLYGRFGTVLGDVILAVEDDPAREQVQIVVRHPGAYTDISRDNLGNVKGYTIEEQRSDPRPSAKDGDQVTYKEVVGRAGELVTYETFLDGEPYAWNGVTAVWAEAYGFVPLIAVQHLDIGVGWGYSELLAGLPKMREVDDIASKLHDQIRKLVDAPWLFIGVTDPLTPSPETSPDSSSSPARGREQIPALYGPIGADAKPLVADLDIAGVNSRIDGIVVELERDYPELRADISTATGDASGRALRTARQPVTSKVSERRVNYDNGLKRAIQMAIAIGGMRKYEGYQGFGLESYAAGDLDFNIAARPVFEDDPLDALEISTAFWSAAKAAHDVGGEEALYMFLEEAGWDEVKIGRLKAAAEKQKQEAIALMQQTGGQAAGQPGQNDQQNNLPPAAEQEPQTGAA